jgi:hypothetical protein
MELLAPYCTEINGARRALQKDADEMGVSLDDYWAMILAALSSHLEAELAELGVSGTLTLAHVTGDDRAITTLIASWLRDTVTLFDGTQPLGVRFTSKHGHPAGSAGRCWAYWMRAKDAGLPEPVRVLAEEPIGENDQDLSVAQKFCKIQTR